jgi:NAD(P)-dependent dehydrogenase (short-subunit alcohol dehydrogenase family)
VHGAGIQKRQPASEFSVADWRGVLNVNLEAPFFLSTSVFRSQRARGAVGSHIFVGSLSSSLGLANAAAYAASKSGTLGVVRTLAVEWASAGVRVNCLGPGYFATALTADLFDDEARAQWVLSRIPMQRLGTADDLAGAVVFLLSDASSYITGQLLNIDGGWLAG